MADYLIKDTTLSDIADAIRGKTGQSGNINVSDFTEKINGIETGGGGFVEGVHFVTFMNHDGTEELYRRPVADGDDCADPVKRGLITEPAKASTVQYNYTHVGWSEAPDGALDSNILKAVKADKTVYANFAAVVRYYTVTYYDGETVLKTQSLAYGSIPSYKPTPPSGYKFSAWLPEPSEVTGNASYTVVWEALPAFAASTWAEIAAVCEAGNAASTYALGDTKQITLTNGKVLTFEIVGFNHDDLADGSGKASITCMLKDSNLDSKQKWSPGKTSWSASNIRTTVRNYLNLFPTDLKNLVKTVTKQTLEGKNQSDAYTAVTTSEETLWLPSGAETTIKKGSITYPDGTQYAQFATAENRIRYYKGGAVEYYLRSTPAMWNDYPDVVSTSGNVKTSGTTTSSNARAYLMFGFCI